MGPRYEPPGAGVPPEQPYMSRCGPNVNSVAVRLKVRLIEAGDADATGEKMHKILMLAGLAAACSSQGALAKVTFQKATLEPRGEAQATGAPYMSAPLDTITAAMLPTASFTSTATVTNTALAATGAIGATVTTTDTLSFLFQGAAAGQFSKVRSVTAAVTAPGLTVRGSAYGDGTYYFSVDTPSVFKADYAAIANTTFADLIQLEFLDNAATPTQTFRVDKPSGSFTSSTLAAGNYLVSFHTLGGSGDSLNQVGTRTFAATINYDFSIDAATPAVPEPATWVMMLAGFGVAGRAMRRRPKARAKVGVA